MVTKSTCDADESARVKFYWCCHISMHAPRMLIVDSMHYLFLGSVKHFLKSILIGKYIIFEAQFYSILIPHCSCRYCKICSDLASFMAD